MQIDILEVFAEAQRKVTERANSWLYVGRSMLKEKKKEDEERANKEVAAIRARRRTVFLPGRLPMLACCVGCRRELPTMEAARPHWRSCRSSPT